MVASPCPQEQGDLAYPHLSSMPIRTLELYNLELSAWLRSLDFMDQEYSFLKNDISRILDSFSNEQMVELADRLQGNILHNETGMNLLREDILKQKKIIATSGFQEFLPTELISTQNSLRTKLQYMEKEFFIKKNSFFHDFVLNSFV